MPAPNPRSPSLDRLDAVHADDEDPVTAEDVTEKRIEADRDLARLIADHPHISMSAADVLAAADYDHGELRKSAAGLYPARFGGEA